MIHLIFFWTQTKLNLTVNLKEKCKIGSIKGNLTSTFRNCNQNKTRAASKYQHGCLDWFPAEALQERQTPQPSRELDHTEDELREVDVQAEVPNAETQSVVHQAGSEPAFK